MSGHQPVHGGGLVQAGGGDGPGDGQEPKARRWVHADLTGTDMDLVAALSDAAAWNGAPMSTGL